MVEELWMLMEKVSKLGLGSIGVVIFIKEFLWCMKCCKTSSCIWQLGCRVAIILLGCDFATDAVLLYQYTGTRFSDLGRVTG